MSSPAHQIIEQQRQAVAELRMQADTTGPQPVGEKEREVRAKLAEAEAQLQGMERIFQAVFGTSGAR